MDKTILKNFKNWVLMEDISTDDQMYLESINKKMWARIYTPHNFNKFKWSLKIANVEGFDKWSFAQFHKECESLEELADVISSIDINKKLNSDEDN